MPEQPVVLGAARRQTGLAERLSAGGGERTEEARPAERRQTGNGLLDGHGHGVGRNERLTADAVELR